MSSNSNNNTTSNNINNSNNIGLRNCISGTNREDSYQFWQLAVDSRANNVACNQQHAYDATNIGALQNNFSNNYGYKRNETILKTTDSAGDAISLNNASLDQVSLNMKRRSMTQSSNSDV